MGHKFLVRNKKARHDYEILETFETGIVLKGTEIKSLKEGGASLQEAYVRVISGEVYLIGATIIAYKFGNIHNHAEQQDRKLLMHKREILRLAASVKEKGLTLVPLSIYLKRGRAKLEIGLGRGKKLYDKRESIKNKELKRSMQRELKNS
jgi:SsrA-binding protein